MKQTSGESIKRLKLRNKIKGHGESSLQGRKDWSSIPCNKQKPEGGSSETIIGLSGSRAVPINFY